MMKIYHAPNSRSVRIVWLFSLVLGYSRFLFARYVLHQDLQTLLRCHMQAFELLDGVPIEILYDRMKTAVIGEDAAGVVTYNESLVALLAEAFQRPKRKKPPGLQGGTSNVEVALR